MREMVGPVGQTVCSAWTGQNVCSAPFHGLFFYLPVNLQRGKSDRALQETKGGDQRTRHRAVS